MTTGQSSVSKRSKRAAASRLAMRSTGRVFMGGVELSHQTKRHARAPRREAVGVGTISDDEAALGGHGQGLGGAQHAARMRLEPHGAAGFAGGDHYVEQLCSA